MPERDNTRINERIRVPEVRLIDETGTQVGVMRTDEALRYAMGKELDLVEVAPEAKPPVCRVLDYSKYKYEQAQKIKAAKKHQQQITIREIKFRPKIAEHDYATKKGHVERFLRHKDKVKITIMFRGREVTHPERGVMILDRLAEDLADLCQIEQRPIQDGRNMTMLLGPSKAVLAGTLEEDAAAAAAAAAAIEAEEAEYAAQDAADEAARAAGASDAAAAPDAGGADADAPEADADAPEADAVAPEVVADAAEAEPAVDEPADADVDEPADAPDAPAEADTVPVEADKDAEKS
jgi:translation initiation factor IF-3